MILSLVSNRISADARDRYPDKKKRRSDRKQTAAHYLIFSPHSASFPRGKEPSASGKVKKKKKKS